LVLSGILKGFENVNNGIDLRKRYSETFTCDVNGTQIFTCLESTIVELNWGYVGISCVGWKSGECSSLDK
jgi:hypothetical protein